MRSYIPINDLNNYFNSMEVSKAICPSTSPIFTQVRSNEGINYLINLQQIIANSPIINIQKLIKCKYCKSYPFNISNNTNTKQCNLCQSINDYQLWYQGLQCANQYVTHYSYILQLKDKLTQLSSMTFVFLIDLTLSSDHLQLFVQALVQNYKQSPEAKICLICGINNKLAIIDHSSSEVIHITEDINVKQLIEAHKSSIDQNSFESISQMLEELSFENKSVARLNEIIINYNLNGSSNHYQHTLIYITKNNITNEPIVQTHQIYVIVLLVVFETTCTSNNYLQTIKNTHEAYLVDSNTTAFYYKIFQILQNRKNVTKGDHCLRTSKNNGKILQTPGLYLTNGKYLQVLIDSNEKVKIQVFCEYYDCQTLQRYQLVVNWVQDKIVKSIQDYNWVQRYYYPINSIMRHLFNKFHRQADLKSKLFDFSFVDLQINNQINYYSKNQSKVILQVRDYFKQFQKDSIKFVLPFFLLDRCYIAFLFYPLSIPGQIIHYYHYYTVMDEDNQNLESSVNQINNFMKLYYSQSIKLPIYYRICTQSENIITNFN